MKAERPLVRGACACFCLRPVLVHPGIPAISFGDGPSSEYSRLSCLIQSGTPGLTLAVQHCRPQAIEYAILTVLSPRGLVCDEGRQIPEESGNRSWVLVRILPFALRAS